MNNQFTSMDYELDKEYRQRQMNRSEQTRRADQVDDRPGISEQLMSANIISAFLIIVSIITLVVFFTMGTGTTHAQTGFDSGVDGSGGAEVHMYLAQSVASVREGDFEAANMLLEEALLVAPDFAAAYMTQSYIALQTENYDDALTLAETALDITPGDSAVYFLLAEAQFALEDYESAQANYETYRDMVYAQGYQPILITALLDDDSLPIVEEHLAACIEENTI